MPSLQLPDTHREFLKTLDKNQCIHQCMQWGLTQKQATKEYRQLHPRRMQATWGIIFCTLLSVIVITPPLQQPLHDLQAQTQCFSTGQCTLALPASLNSPTLLFASLLSTIWNLPALIYFLRWRRGDLALANQLAAVLSVCTLFAAILYFF